MDSKKIDLRIGETSIYLKRIMKGKRIGMDEMLFVTTNLMTFVRDYPELSGVEKKELVEKTIRQNIKGINVDNDGDKVFLNLAFEKIVPGAIDLLVDVSKGKYKFKNVKKIFPC